MRVGPVLGTRLWAAAGPTWVWYACAALGATMALGFTRIASEGTIEQAA